MSTRGVDRETGGRRLTARQEETVAKLLDAAVVELRSQGYEGLSVRAVAAAAGTAPATAYNYFSSKDHLVAEVFWRKLRALEDVGAAEGQVTERVAAALGAVAMLVADDPSLSSACTVALLGTEPDVRRLRDRIGADVRRRIVEALDGEGDDHMVNALEFTYSGAMLQVGMGHIDYHDLPDRLASVVSIVCGAHRATDPTKGES